MTRGGRPLAIERGDLHIDVAFIAVPSCDKYGNINGTRGKTACGYIAYAYPDAQYADVAVAVTDELVSYPNCPIDIARHLVDYVVVVESTGDPNGIVSGSTRIITGTVRLRIASDTANFVDAAGNTKKWHVISDGRKRNPPRCCCGGAGYSYRSF